MLEADQFLRHKFRDAAIPNVSFLVAATVEQLLFSIQSWWPPLSSLFLSLYYSIDFVKRVAVHIALFYTHTLHCLIIRQLKMRRNRPF